MTHRMQQDMTSVGPEDMSCVCVDVEDTGHVCLEARDDMSCVNMRAVSSSPQAKVSQFSHPATDPRAKD